MILLDTCTLIWYVGDPDLLSLLAKQMIDEHLNDMYISDISAFELSKLAKKKKINLPLEVKAWYYQILEQYQIQAVPLTSDVIFLSEELPAIHRDPIDRFLIATALAYDLTLLTPDQTISKYPGVKTVW